jgi:hypothetical protein
VQFDAGELGTLPLAAPERGHRLRNVARRREKKGDGVLGGAHDVRGRRVNNHDAGLGRGIDVDVVEPDTRSCHDTEVGRARQRFAVDPGRAAHDQSVGAGQGRKQGTAVGAVGVADLKVGFEQLDASGRKLLSDKDDGLGHVGGPSDPGGLVARSLLASL